MTFDEEVNNIKQKQMNRILFLIMTNSLGYDTEFRQISEIVKTGSTKTKDINPISGNMRAELYSSLF